MSPIRVPPDLPRKSPCPIAFVAESPGDEEVAHDPPRPLVGPSGRLFNQLLRIAGIERADCLVTNVFNEQLPKNDVAAWCAPTKERDAWPDYDLPPIVAGARRMWLRLEHAHHLSRLRDELRAVAPTLIVALGGTALWALTGQCAVDPCRGVPMCATRLMPGVKLLPTFHPAFLFHGYHWFPVVAMDFAKALTESRDAALTVTPREVWLEPTLDDLREFEVRHLHSCDLLSVDIETIPRWRAITCIGFAPSANVALVVPFVDWRKTNRSYWVTAEEEFEAWQWCRRVLASPVPKLGQNFTYDYQWLYDAGLPTRNYREDTRLLHHALQPELPKSLQFLGSCYAREHAWKQLRPKEVWKRDE